jgi:hypothetical protein
MALPRGILHNNERIGNDMRTKVYLLWQHAKIVGIHHFSEHSKVPPKFRTSTVLIVSQRLRDPSS